MVQADLADQLSTRIQHEFEMKLGYPSVLTLFGPRTIILS